MYVSLRSTIILLALRLLGNILLAIFLCRRTCHGLFLHPSILRKRLGLAVAAVYPLLEVFEVRCGHDNPAPVFPTFLIVGQIVALRLVHVVEAKHHLMLVKRAVGIVLVHHIHLAPVPTVNIVGEEHVYMVSVHALRAAEVAVGVVHPALPYLAVSIGSSAHAALRLLDSDVKRANLHVAFLIVPSLFLRLGGFGVYLCRCSRYLLRKRYSLIFRRLIFIFLLCSRSLFIFARRRNSVLRSSCVIPLARKGFVSVCRIVGDTVFLFKGSEKPILLLIVPR